MLALPAPHPTRLQQERAAQTLPVSLSDLSPEASVTQVDCTSKTCSLPVVIVYFLFYFFFFKLFSFNKTMSAASWCLAATS